MQLFHQRWILRLTVPLVLAGVLWAVRAPLLGAAGGWLACSSPLQRVDYLLIMPGAENTRPLAAAALVRHGWADAVVIPANVERPGVQDQIVPPTHEIIRRVLALRGVPPEQIIVLDQLRSNSSWDDLRALAEFLQEHPQATAGVITNDYHVRRTRWTARRVLGRGATPLVFGAPTDGFGPDDWWHYRDGVWLYGGEYAKLIAYWIVYGEPLAWVVLIVTAVISLLAWKLKRRGGERSAAGVRG